MKSDVDDPTQQTALADSGSLLKAMDDVAYLTAPNGTILGVGDSEIVRLCSYCHAIAWPPGSKSDAIQWIKPEEYYRLGGSTEVLVSHGICPGCFNRLMEKPGQLATRTKGTLPQVVENAHHRCKHKPDDLGPIG
ncbi:MAG: hypothetical protein AB7E69_16195 [Sphingomonadales bacterium]